MKTRNQIVARPSLISLPNTPHDLLLPASRLLNLFGLDLQEILHHSPRTSRHGAYQRPVVFREIWTSALIRDLDDSEMGMELAAKEIY